ncbi:PorP/SprF family type IX secretion system membrane protein [Echinicola pacifica]|nr:type IX secretion system membrane protein PorP/SprF [Echinicola pacifica]
MKKRIYLIFTFLTGILMLAATDSKLYAQQDAQFTQYMYNGLYYNPAYAGREDGYQFSALHRSQWLGYSTTSGQGGAPTTQLVTATGRIPGKSIGWGFSFVNDDIGPVTSQELNLSAAYHLKMRRGHLSLGVSGGFFSNTINFDEIDVVNPDPTIPSNGDETQMTANFGAGLMYEAPKYYISLSSRHVNEPTFEFGEDSFENQLVNHSYLMVGYKIKTFAQVTFDPSFLLKSEGFDNFSYDLSVIATHNDRISGGLSYRGEESVSVLFGYKLLRDRSLRIGYAFDIVVNGNEAKSPTSHEFMLTYNLPSVSKKIESIIQRTPRFRF